jgi:hypothetical protein
MALDLETLRLQYEILNVPLATIAQRARIPLDLLQREATNKSWKPLWSEEDSLPLEIEEGDDEFELKSNAFIEQTRRKLQAYSLAKDLLLAQKYLDVEVGILNKAKEIIDTMESPSASCVRTLASLYKDMSKGLLSAGGAASVSVGIDENGLPTAIIRDLTGRGGK